MLLADLWILHSCSVVRVITAISLLMAGCLLYCCRQFCHGSFCKPISFTVKRIFLSFSASLTKLCWGLISVIFRNIIAISSLNVSVATFCPVYSCTSAFHLKNPSSSWILSCLRMFLTLVMKQAQTLLVFLQDLNVPSSVSAPVKIAFFEVHCQICVLFYK